MSAAAPARWAAMLARRRAQPAALRRDRLAGLVVDRSKSIDERELALQRGAYIRLLSDAT